MSPGEIESFGRGFKLGAESARNDMRARVEALRAEADAIAAELVVLRAEVVRLEASVTQADAGAPGWLH
jgi:hypothetical protein